MDTAPNGVIVSVATDDRHLRTLNVRWADQPGFTPCRIENLVCTTNDDYTPLGDEAPAAETQRSGTIVAVDDGDHRFRTLVVEWSGGRESVQELVRLEHLVVGWATQ